MAIYDVPVQKLITQIAEDLKSIKEIEAPDWSQFVKTGTHKERPPQQRDWWHIRAASVLRNIFKNGPVGVSKLRTKYGGRKNRGLRPDRFHKASGKVIRTILQQLETAGFIAKEEKEVHRGRIITPQGQAFLDKASNKVNKSGKQQNAGKEKPAIKSAKAN